MKSFATAVKSKNLSRRFIGHPTSCHGTVPSSIPQNLQQAKFVFIRRDAHRKPLQRPYEGPFKLIQPGLKTFQVDVGGRSETISVDRLKPAEIDLEHPTQVAVPRRRGRPCKLPPQHISVLGWWCSGWLPRATNHSMNRACIYACTCVNRT